LALILRKLWVVSLGYGCAKDVQTADVLVLRGDAAKRLIQPLGISSSELRNSAHAENFKIAQHGGAY